MSDKFTAFSMSSTHIKMTIAFLRMSTPIIPILNKTALRAKYQSILIIFFCSRLYFMLCDDKCSYNGGGQKNSGEFKGQQIFGKKHISHRFHHSHFGHFFRNDRKRVREAADTVHKLGEYPHPQQECNEVFDAKLVEQALLLIDIQQHDDK